MSVQKRKTPAGTRFVVRWRDAAKQQHSKTFTTHTEAARYDREIHNALDKGTYINPRDGALPFADVIDQWFQAKHDLRPSTRRTYGHIIGTVIKPRLGHVRLNQLTPADLRLFIAALVDHGYSASRIQAAAQIINQILNQAVQDQLIVRNPAVNLSLPAQKPKQMTVASPAEVAALDKAAGDLGIVMTFLAYTGLRWGEMAALEVSDVDVLRGEVRVSKSWDSGAGRVGPTKTGKSRTVPLEPRLFGRVKEHIAGRPADAPLFPGPKGGRLNHNWFTVKRWPKIKAAAGVPGDFHLHDLRHTAATWIVQLTDLKTASEFLGHSSLQSTAIYLHSSPDRLHAAAAALSTLSDTPPSTGNVRAIGDR